MYSPRGSCFTLSISPRAFSMPCTRALHRKCQTAFSTSDKEEPNDVENAVWHFLCTARVQGMEKARGEMLKVKQDPRGEYMMKIYQMFKGEAKPDDVFAAAEAGTVPDAVRHKQRFYANYYVGMFNEATGEA